MFWLYLASDLSYFDNVKYQKNCSLEIATAENSRKIQLIMTTDMENPVISYFLHLKKKNISEKKISLFFFVWQVEAYHTGFAFIYAYF